MWLVFFMESTRQAFPGSARDNQDTDVFATFNGCSGPTPKQCLFFCSNGRTMREDPESRVSTRSYRCLSNQLLERGNNTTRHVAVSFTLGAGAPFPLIFCRVIRLVPVRPHFALEWCAIQLATENLQKPWFLDQSVPLRFNSSCLQGQFCCLYCPIRGRRYISIQFRAVSAGRTSRDAWPAQRLSLSTTRRCSVR